MNTNDLNSLIKQDDFRFIDPNANGGFMCVYNGTHYYTLEDALFACTDQQWDDAVDAEFYRLFNLYHKEN